MKIDYDSDDEGLNMMLNPMNGYYEWSPEEVIEYLVFMDNLDVEVADDMLRSPETYDV